MRDRVSAYLIFPLMQALNGSVEMFKLCSPNFAVQLLAYLSHPGKTTVSHVTWLSEILQAKDAIVYNYFFCKRD